MANEQEWLAGLHAGPFPTHAVWAIADLSGTIVGLTQLNNIHWINRVAEFGIWIGPEFWSRGHATFGTALTCRYAFDELALRQIRLSVLSSHVAARAVYTKVGFAEESTQRGAVLIDGEPQDLITMLLEPASFHYFHRLGT
jgi:RimJ/RimL family protein N-acetyltransferase